MLLALGNKREALDLLNKAFEKHLSVFGDEEHFSDLLDYYKLRAENYFALGRYDLAASDLEDALGAARRCGDKLIEPDVYWLQGQLNQKMMDFNDSFEAYQAAIDLYEILARPVKVIEVKLDLMLLYAEYGMEIQARALWEDILKSIDKGFVPDEVVIEAYQHWAQANRWFSDMQTRAQFIEKANMLAKKQGYDALVDESIGGGDSLLRSASLKPLLLRLDPTKSYTVVKKGESALTRLVLSNLGSLPYEGHFALKGMGAQVDWDEARGELRYLIRSDDSIDDAQSSTIVIHPNEQIFIYIEYPEVNEKKTIELVWEADTPLKARWDIHYDEATLKRVQIVNWADAQYSALHALPFYQEMYIRKMDTPFQDIRVVADQPIRIELWDAQTRELIAIDATGNGSFEDAGDVIVYDANNNLFPEVFITEDNSVRALEILTFPNESGNIDKPIEIAVELSREGQWELQAINKIRP